MAEIVSTPGVFGGKPRLAGYRIAVVDIAEQLGELRPRSRRGASCFHDALCIRPNAGERRERSLHRR
jgi:hypothetical protein